jgi:hypothetical protein
MKSIATITIGVTAVLLLACGSAGTPLTQGVPTPTSVPGASAGASKVTFTNENWALAVSDANSYKGSPVTLFGKIFLEPQKTADSVAFQMYADAPNSGQNTAVAGLPPTSDFKRNDFVKVTGTLFDMLEGTNALNATLRIPRIRADSVVKVSRAEVMAPTLKSVELNQSQRQFGISITLQKIEFAKTETRLFVKVENAGPAKANVYGFNAIVVQGTTQSKQKSVFDSGYPDLPSGMLAGIAAETVLMFDPLQVAPLRFVWSASSDNYGQRFQDYVWEVTP